MSQDCCNQTPEWTKSCCSSTWQCNLWHRNHLLGSNWKGCSTPKHLCCNSSDYLDQPSWHSQDKTPFELNTLRLQEHDSYYLPKPATTDHCWLANVLAERLWEFQSYCPLSSKISKEATDHTQFLPRNKDVTGLQTITHPAVTHDENVSCSKVLYKDVKGENSNSMGIHDQILAIQWLVLLHPEVWFKWGKSGFTFTSTAQPTEVKSSALGLKMPLFSSLPSSPADVMLHKTSLKSSAAVSCCPKAQQNWSTHWFYSCIYSRWGDLGHGKSCFSLDISLVKQGTTLHLQIPI